MDDLSGGDHSEILYLSCADDDDEHRFMDYNVAIALGIANSDGDFECDDIFMDGPGRAKLVIPYEQEGR